ncbi:helix-turn-helix domain-containing protein [Allosalinactinospora lopnorensis]|uniref:helix-turn-helix domain-containing protein n=1 Tax=Allosalinactinospora lopnorensis TaxID=1352348 RepID=UPI000623D2F1|nr:helix-turn-helix transcriptional regulator [Allosalinactinospora lopnorensis]
MPRKATVRARGLGAELKELRQRAGLTTRQVGELMNSSTATVSRIETGQRGVTSEEVAAMMVIYKANPEERDRLVGLAREVDRPGWWETGDSNLPKQLTALIGFEAQATRITEVAMLGIPGLLQTPEYARATMEVSGVPAVAAETRVVTRMGRQTLLNRADSPQLTVIIDEAALRRPLGGPGVMADQLRHISEAGQRDNIDIRVVPFSHGGHPAMSGAFSMLEFKKAATIVHLEHLKSSIFVDDPRDVEAFRSAVAKLEEIALNRTDSAKFVTDVARSYEEP